MSRYAIATILETIGSPLRRYTRHAGRPFTIRSVRRPIPLASSRLRRSTRHLSPRPTPKACASVLVLVLLAAAGVNGQGASQLYKDPNGRFTFEYPKKNWQVFPGAGSTLATIGEKKGKASVQIEYLQLKQAVKAEENYDLIVGIESDLIRERQLGASQIAGQPMRPDMNGVIIIDYARPGAGAQERVRQYSIVKDQSLYRVLCVSPASEFQKFEPTFGQIARSFVITAKIS